MNERIPESHARRDDSRTQRLARPRPRRADRVHARPTPVVRARLWDKVFGDKYRLLALATKVLPWLSDE